MYMYIYISLFLSKSTFPGLFFSDCARDENGGSLYDFNMTSLDGTEVVDFGEYAGKVGIVFILKNIYTLIGRLID